MYSTLSCKDVFIKTHDPIAKDGFRDVKLYKIELLKYHGSVSCFMDILSTAEVNRADRYHFAKDKNQFIICRTLLKFLLAQHTGLNIAKINLEVDPHKKPYLPSHPKVFFNLTHAGDYAIIAIASSPVGVDIEFINQQFDYNDILPSVFTPMEIEEITNSEDKHHSFYRFWTRKEAIVKAIGTGLDDNLSKIPATDGLHAVPTLLLGGHKKMTVLSFNINDDYLGAFAISEDLDHLGSVNFSPLPSLDTVIHHLKKDS